MVTERRAALCGSSQIVPRRDPPALILRSSRTVGDLDLLVDIDVWALEYAVPCNLRHFCSCKAHGGQELSAHRVRPPTRSRGRTSIDVGAKTRSPVGMDRASYFLSPETHFRQKASWSERVVLVSLKKDMLAGGNQRIPHNPQTTQRRRTQSDTEARLTRPSGKEPVEKTKLPKTDARESANSGGGRERFSLHVLVYSPRYGRRRKVRILITPAGNCPLAAVLAAQDAICLGGGSAMGGAREKPGDDQSSKWVVGQGVACSISERDEFRLDIYDWMRRVLLYATAASLSLVS